jgi:hypothetical protein
MMKKKSNSETLFLLPLSRLFEEYIFKRATYVFTAGGIRPKILHLLCILSKGVHLVNQVRKVEKILYEH